MNLHIKSHKCLDTLSLDYTLFTLPSQQGKSLQADVNIERHVTILTHVNMEVDTEAAVSILGDKICTNLPHFQKLLHQLS